MSNRLILQDVSPGVRRVSGSRADISAETVGDLMTRVRRTGKTHRILLHPGADDPIQEMLIVHPRMTYIRPHKQVTTSKSYYLIRGDLEVVMFDENGTVIEHYRMRQFEDGGPVATRVMEDGFHTVFAVSDETAFVEILPGPFSGTVFADWAPEADGGERAEAFFRKLLGQIGMNPGVGQ